MLLGDVTVADSSRALRVLETSQAPAIYFPPEDIAMDHLRESRRSSLCEWKGRAVYYDLQAGERRAEAAAWAYPDPVARYAELAGHVAFYAQSADACWLRDELVAPNQGDFYGGWVTSDITGPFKGGPGSSGW